MSKKDQTLKSKYKRQYYINIKQMIPFFPSPSISETTGWGLEENLG